MTKLIVIKQNQSLETSRQRILDILFKFPEKEFSLTELAGLARIAKANIGRILDELHKKELIQIIKFNNLWRITAHQANINFIRNKIIYNLKVIYKSRLIEFLNGYFKNPKAIVLFGSFRKGEDISGSDIDIAIESDEIKDYNVIGLKELDEFQKITSRRIQIHLFNRKKVDINVFNNIANGIVLSGFLEVKP